MRSWAPPWWVRREVIQIQRACNHEIKRFCRRMKSASQITHKPPPKCSCICRNVNNPPHQRLPKKWHGPSSTSGTPGKIRIGPSNSRADRDWKHPIFLPSPPQKSVTGSAYQTLTWLQGRSEPCLPTMPRFPIHDLSDTEFEQLVVLICRELMGIGITSFAPGRDGGKDAKYEGSATAFPSSAAPASGKFTVQARHSSSPVGSCSDSFRPSRKSSAAPPCSTSTPTPTKQAGTSFFSISDFQRLSFYRFPSAASSAKPAPPTASNTSSAPSAKNSPPTNTPKTSAPPPKKSSSPSTTAAMVGGFAK
jgi:hypothetical protein